MDVLYIRKTEERNFLVKWWCHF